MANVINQSKLMIAHILMHTYKLENVRALPSCLHPINRTHYVIYIQWVLRAALFLQNGSIYLLICSISSLPVFGNIFGNSRHCIEVCVRWYAADLSPRCRQYTYIVRLHMYKHTHTHGYEISQQKLYYIFSIHFIDERQREKF